MALFLLTPSFECITCQWKLDTSTLSKSTTAVMFPTFYWWCLNCWKVMQRLVTMIVIHFDWCCCWWRDFGTGTVAPPMLNKKYICRRGRC